MQFVTIWVTLVPWPSQDSGTKDSNDRLRLILGRLNVATSARDMDLPGLDLHELRGPRKGTWAVNVSGNWRVTFTCAGKDVDRVDYEDDH
jgi:proteic killer suppression protein